VITSNLGQVPEKRQTWMTLPNLVQRNPRTAVPCGTLAQDLQKSKKRSLIRKFWTDFHEKNAKIFNLEIFIEKSS